MGVANTANIPMKLSLISEGNETFRIKEHKSKENNSSIHGLLINKES